MKILATSILLMMLAGCSETTTNIESPSTPAPAEDNAQPSEPETLNDPPEQGEPDTDDQAQDQTDTPTPSIPEEDENSPQPPPENESDDESQNVPEETPEPEPEPEPEPAPPIDETRIFEGSSFNYPLVKVGFQLLPDERELYSVRASSELEAKSAIEAMHAVNAYRENNIYQVPSTDLRVIQSSCQDDGTRFSAERCLFYSASAYGKTASQDNWQDELNLNGRNGPEVICFQSSDTCGYSLLNEHFNTFFGEGDNELFTVQRLFELSPIERWHFEQVQRRVMAMNRAVFDHAKCAGIAQEPFSVPSVSNARFASFFSGEHYLIWTFSQDVKEDVARETIARTPESSGCNFILEQTVLGL